VNTLADNNSTATATQEDVAAVENSQPERTEATAPAQAPLQSRPKGPTDLLPDMQPAPVDENSKEVANGRAYEIAYIVVANNPEAIENTQARVKALIEGADGAVDNARVSEVRRLAYPIEKRAEGVYVIINARFESTLTEELDRFFKLDETVLRHMILRDN
jgi:small subunit ribosomal protein S6